MHPEEKIIENVNVIQMFRELADSLEKKELVLISSTSDFFASFLDIKIKFEFPDLRKKDGELYGTGFYNGHKTASFDNGKTWVYQDNRELVNHDESRPCPKCNKKNTVDGFDACLGFIPNRCNGACCGHGVRKGYISNADGYFDFEIPEEAKKKVIELREKYGEDK
ncbi:MAG: hypothetical protein Q7R33_05810 [Nitrosarchaeum sp.]|nr:hypothetical protein [Nitrosarchaeum sp.]